MRPSRGITGEAVGVVAAMEAVVMVVVVVVVVVGIPPRATFFRPYQGGTLRPCPHGSFPSPPFAATYCAPPHPLGGRPWSWLALPALT